MNLGKWIRSYIAEPISLEREAPEEMEEVKMKEVEREKVPEYALVKK